MGHTGVGLELKLLGQRWWADEASKNKPWHDTGIRPGKTTIMGLIQFLRDLVSDEYTDERGYKRFKDSEKLVHRAVAKKKLGRTLRPGEVVHHKDRNKTNNEARNLWVFKDQAAHDRAHKYDAKRFGKRASYQGFR